MIPKTLKHIEAIKAQALIAKHIKANTGYWEYGEPMVGDFIYKKGQYLYMIRPGWGGRFETGRCAG